MSIDSQHIAGDDVTLPVPRCGHDRLVVLAPGASSEETMLDYATRLDVHKGVVRLCVEAAEGSLRSGEQAVVDTGKSLRLVNDGHVEVRILMCRCAPTDGPACPNRIGRW